MTADQLSTTFAALADPTRRAILARLRRYGESSVKELARPFPLTLQAVSKHLRVLESAGIVERSSSAQMRPARIRTPRLREAAKWLETYAFWDASFDALEEKLEERPADG